MTDLVVTNWFGDVSSSPAAVVEATSVADQTPQLTPAQMRRAYGDRLEAFAQARRAHDPDGRLLNPYFGALLGAHQRSTARRRSPARQGALR
jgi:hypothetical protein